MEPIIFLIIALATWRLSNLIANEEGPFDLLDTFRYWVGVRFDERPPFERYGTNEFAKMLVCMWCNSIWIGLSYTILYMIYKPLWILALPFALSAVAIWIDGYFEDEED